MIITFISCLEFNVFDILLCLFLLINPNVIGACDYYTSRFLRPATQVPYNAIPLWLLQVGVPLRVLQGYSAITACAVAPVTVTPEYPHCTL